MSDIGKILECDIQRRRGDTKPITIKLKDSAGAAIDVTGYAGVLTVDPTKAPVDNTTKVFDAPATLTGTPADGLLVFDMSAIVTLPPGNYYYDIQVTDASGFICTVVTGRFKTTQDITK